MIDQFQERVSTLRGIGEYFLIPRNEQKRHFSMSITDEHQVDQRIIEPDNGHCHFYPSHTGHSSPQYVHRLQDRSRSTLLDGILHLLDDRAADGHSAIESPHKRADIRVCTGKFMEFHRSCDGCDMCMPNQSSEKHWFLMGKW